MKPFEFILALALLTFLPGCKPDSQSGSAEASRPRTFEVRGTLREISSDHRLATIQHSEIPGYMSAMTMPFNVKVPHEIEGIETGSDIIFKLVVDTNTHWIEDIHFAGSSIAKTTNAPVAPLGYDLPQLELGQLVPDGELLGENGKPVHFADYRGKALAFTFFFSRCPLPDYCPRMARNFLQAREALLAAAAPTNWQFLSISFDPGFDDPEVLTAYGNYARGGTNTDRWLFASMPANVLASLAPKLGLKVVPDGESISHNLRTVVLDPQGGIFWQANGNSWTPEELTGVISQAAQRTGGK
jgi:protein SCO1/2